MGVLSQYMLVEVHLLEIKSIKEELANSIYCISIYSPCKRCKKTSNHYNELRLTKFYLLLVGLLLIFFGLIYMMVLVLASLLVILKSKGLTQQRDLADFYYPNFARFKQTSFRCARNAIALLRDVLHLNAEHIAYSNQWK